MKLAWLLAAGIALAGASGMMLGLHDASSAFEQDPGSASFSRWAAIAGTDVSWIMGSTQTAATHDPSATAWFILQPDRAYAAQDVDNANAFLMRGGTIVVVDAAGATNALTGPHGIFVEPSPILADEAVRIASVGPGASATLRTTANNPSPLVLSADATMLAQTTGDVVMDRDRDGRVGQADPVGPFAVAASQAVGDGRLVVLSAPGALLAAPGDAEADAWASAFFAEAFADRERIIIDETHRAQGAIAPAMFQAAGALGDRLWVAVAAFGAVTGAIAWRLLYRPWRLHRFDADAYRPRSALADGETRSIERTDPTADLGHAHGVTPAGAASLAAGAIALVLGIGHASTQLTVAGLGVLALCVAAPAGTGRAAIASSRLSTDHVVEGHQCEVTLDIQAPRGIFQLRPGIPAEAKVDPPAPETLLCSPTKTAAHEILGIEPAARGAYRIGPIRCRQQDPLGLWYDDARLGGSEVLEVAPRGQALQRWPAKVRRPDILMGAHGVNRAGDGSEFHALREYQAGDSLRSVNWKASARSKAIMVNQRIQESRTHFTVLVDGRAIAECGPASSTAFAEAARHAATLAIAVGRTRDTALFIVYGDEPITIDMARGKSTLEDLHKLLSRHTPRGTASLQSVAGDLALRIKKGTPVVICSGLEDDAGAGAAVRQLIAAGATVTVLSPQLTIDPLLDPGAEAALQARAATIAEIRGVGAHVHEPAPGAALERMFQLAGVA